MKRAKSGFRGHDVRRSRWYNDKARQPETVRRQVIREEYQKNSPNSRPVNSAMLKLVDRLAQPSVQACPMIPSLAVGQDLWLDATFSPAANSM
jgi:hypothetical protein